MLRLIGCSSISRLPSLNSTYFAFAGSFLHNKNLAASWGVDGFSSKSLHYDPMARRKFAICSSNVTPPPLPSGSPSGSMRNWVVCIVLTFVLPFFTHKWGPLILLKNRVDTVVNTAEHIMEAIEDVAGKLDTVIDNITDDLPENSKIRKTLEAVDQLVEGVTKTAHIANDLIDKVEEAEDKLESFIAKEEKKVTKVVNVEKVEIPPTHVKN